MSFGCGVARRLWLLILGPALAVTLAFLAPQWTVHAYGESIETWIVASAIVLSALIGLAVSLTPLADPHYRPIGVQEDATVIIADLRASTELLRTLGPDRYTRVMTELLNECSRVVRKNGGEVERATGDGFLAVFRGRKRKPHTVRSVEATKGLMETALQVGKTHGLNLALSVGIESGEVGGTYVEEAGRTAWMSAGRTVNLAQRLMASCSDFQVSVAIGPGAKARLGFGYPLISVGTFEPKGFSESVEVSTIASEKNGSG
jgi:class 3 adenylate cyclase